MKYIKTYESFNVNETLDMFTMPVDPIKGSLEMWSDILDGIWSGIQKYYKGAKDNFLSGIREFCDDMFNIIKNPQEILDKISAYFKSPAQDLTWKQIYDGIVQKNPTLLKESREDEMEEHMEKDFGQKVLSILQGIFGINAFGGVVVGFVAWIIEKVSNFDIFGWAQSLGVPQAMTNPGSRGFMVVWFVVSILAVAILALIKKADAWLSTDKGVAGKLYNPFK